LAWVTIAEANSLDEFKNAQPSYLKDLPKGTKLRLRIELPSYCPFGKLADIAGAEWWAQWLMPQGIDVIDVYGDWTWIEVQAEVDPPMWPAWVIGAIAIAIAALPFGIAFLISTIKLDADVLSPIVGGATVAIALIALLGLMVVLKKEK